MADEESLRWWLALHHAPRMGPVGIARLLEKVGSPQQLFSAPPAQIQAWGLDERLRSYLRSPNWEAVERDLAWRDGHSSHIITLDDPCYPALLRELADAPPLLYLRGNPDVLSLPQLAMVGSRNPTPQGRNTARQFAGFLASSGLAITSGLAVGIDAASHEGVLGVNGVTLAVTGTGLDRVYPAAHRELAHRIVERGALVSEFAIGVPPRPGHFPRRNRIISGLSLGALVVEANLKSGSLITARCALEQGREVFAIPGSIHSPLARGCHQLIRQGAKLVETGADVMEELGALLGGLESPARVPSQQAASKLDSDYLGLLEIMGYEAEPVDVLAARSGLTAGAISSMLLVLELEGYVAPFAGGGYGRTGQA